MGVLKSYVKKIQGKRVTANKPIGTYYQWEVRVRDNREIMVPVIAKNEEDAIRRAQAEDDDIAGYLSNNLIAQPRRVAKLPWIIFRRDALNVQERVEASDVETAMQLAMDKNKHLRLAERWNILPLIDTPDHGGWGKQKPYWVYPRGNYKKGITVNAANEDTAHKVAAVKHIKELGNIDYDGISLVTISFDNIYKIKKDDLNNDQITSLLNGNKIDTIQIKPLGLFKIYYMYSKNFSEKVLTDIAIKVNCDKVKLLNFADSLKEIASILTGLPIETFYKEEGKNQKLSLFRQMMEQF